MSDEDIKKQLVAIDERIGVAKSELLSHEAIAAKAAERIAACKLELSKLRVQRDEILTPDMFSTH